MRMLITAMYIMCCSSGFAQVGIGTTTPHSSSQLEVNSNNKGFLPPRLTTTERNNIISPTPGLMIFNLTTNKLEVYTAYGWAGVDVSLPKFQGLLGSNVNDIGYDIEPVVGGGYIIAATSSGSNNGTLTGITSNGLQDAWIIRLSNEGSIIWQKLFGGNGNDDALDIEQTTDGGFIIAGRLNNSNIVGMPGFGGEDGWVFKLDADGNLVWQKRFGGAGSDVLRTIQQNADGTFIVGGNANSIDQTLTGVTAYGLQDGWLIKLDAQGSIIWQRRYGGNNHELGNNVQQLADGSFVFCGQSSSSNTGSFVGLNNSGLYDEFLIKVTSNGNMVWQKFYGGTGDDIGYSVRETTDNGFLLAGSSNSSGTGTLAGIVGNGSTDYYVIKTDASGNIVWQKLIGGSADDYSYSVIQTTDGGYILAGYSSSTNTGNLTGISTNGGTDMYVLKLTSTGAIDWQKLYGGTSTDAAYKIRQSIDGGFVVVGYTFSSNTGTLSGLSNNGAIDVWVLKINNTGNPN